MRRVVLIFGLGFFFGASVFADVCTNLFIAIDSAPAISVDDTVMISFSLEKISQMGYGFGVDPHNSDHLVTTGVVTAITEGGVAVVRFYRLSDSTSANGFYLPFARARIPVSYGVFALSTLAPKLDPQNLPPESQGFIGQEFEARVEQLPDSEQWRSVRILEIYANRTALVRYWWRSTFGYTIIAVNSLHDPRHLY